MLVLIREYGLSNGSFAEAALNECLQLGIGVGSADGRAIGASEYGPLLRCVERAADWRLTIQTL